jgi:hypothetical protein
MGYRLPLDSLPWVTAADYPYPIAQDHYAERQALPHAVDRRARTTSPTTTPTSQAAALPKAAPWLWVPAACRGLGGRQRNGSAGRRQPPCPARHQPNTPPAKFPVAALDHPHRHLRGGARPTRANGPHVELAGKA